MNFSAEMTRSQESKLRAIKWRALCGCALTGVFKAVRKTKVEAYLDKKESGVANRVHAALVKERKRIAAKLVEAYARLTKLTEEEQRILDELLDMVDSKGVGVSVVDAIGTELTNAFRQAGLTALAEINIEAGDEIVSHIDVKATAYAAERGAELVTAIGDTTRDEIKDILGDALDEGWSTDVFSDALAEATGFSEYRSTMIARTELAFAHVQGNLEGWRQSGEVAEKQWLASAGACPICQELDGTVVGIDDGFDYDGEEIDGPPGHPNCRCDVLPILKDEGEEESG